MAREQIEAIADEEGLEVLGWRELPVDAEGADLGATALGCMPYMAQIFVAAPDRVGGIELDRRVYPMRKRAGDGETSTSLRCPAGPSRTRAC